MVDNLFTTSLATIFNNSTFSGLREKLEKLYTPQAANKQIDLSFHIKVGQELKPIPKNKLLQITGNLITNAIKFTDPKGFIKVDMNIQTIPGAGQSLEIVIADSGVGINQEGIDAILKGIKASSSGTTGEKGYGFGLSLVKRLIDELHGTLDIQSELGKGTTFTVTLPQ